MPTKSPYVSREADYPHSITFQYIYRRLDIWIKKVLRLKTIEIIQALRSSS